MDIYVFVIIGIIIGYLCGSIPFGLIVGKISHQIDVRKYGSGNLGSTNVARNLGLPFGIIVMFLDLIKCGLPAFLMYKIAEYNLINSDDLIIQSQVQYLSIVYCVTGFFACFGHCNPIFAGFKGGKAVASICGFLLFSNIYLALVALITFIVVAAISKIVSLSSITAAITTPICAFIPFFRQAYLFTHNELNNELSTFIYLLTIVFLALLLIYRHYPNIQRLVKGEEKKFKIEKVYKK